MGLKLSGLKTDLTPKRIVAAYTDTSFTVGSGGQNDFSVSGLDSTSKVDVLVNGIIVPEGSGSNQWQRNVGLNKITTNRAMPQNAIVVVRLYAYE